MYVGYLQSRLREDPNVKIVELWNEVRESGYNGC